MSGQVRPLLVEGLEGGEVLGGVRAEVARGEDAVVDERAGAQAGAPGTVGGDERDVHAALGHEVADGAQVVLVRAVGAVLVLHLHHDDVAAARDLALDELGQQVVVVGGHLGEVLGVLGADAHVALGEEPRGQAAELPLGAHERAHAHDGPEAELGRLVHEARDVELAGEVELSLVGLVHVPSGVGLDRVEARGLEVGERAVPVGRVNAEVVDGTAEHLEGLAVEQEVLVEFEAVALALRVRVVYHRLPPSLIFGIRAPVAPPS